MEFIADLHLHSKYSRAVSRDMVLPIMSAWAKKKGIDILATADWTHPLWFREIQSQLEEKSNGLFQLKSEIRNSKFETPKNSFGITGQANSNVQNPNDRKETLFLLSTEISSIYSQGGKVRRIHNLVLSPSFATCEKINKELVRRHCNLSSDGRPTVGLSSIQLVELVSSVDRKAMIIPCHAWTPWFSLYGSNSGFDSIEECFSQYSKDIYGVETGLSSDPEMNWRIKELDNRSIISSSDAHSPAKMGRECTVFSVQSAKFKVQNYSSKFKVTYEDVAAAIKQDPSSKLEIRYTIEFYPEEGKYHYTGHRNCGVVQSPEETKKNGVICPKCHRPLTVGVMHRVEELASSSSKFKVQSSKLGIKWILDPTEIHPPYVKLVPLLEILAESMNSTVASMKVQGEYDNLCTKLGSEVDVLLRTPIEEIERESSPKIAEGVKKVRTGNIVVEPGYDGEYGKVKIWPDDQKISNNQKGATSVFEEIKEKEEPQLSLDF